MAAQLSQDESLEVHRQRGGLGELRVSVDGTDVVETNRLWYPTPGSVAERVRAYVAPRPPAV